MNGLSSLICDISRLLLILACGLTSTTVLAQSTVVDNCSYASDGKDVCSQSMFELIANPNEFYNKDLYVIGYLAIDFGSLKLWVDEDSFVYDIDANSIAISIPYEEAVMLAKKYNRSYCAISAKFIEVKDKDLGLHSTNSGLTDISQIHPVGKRARSQLDWEIVKQIDTNSGRK